MRALPLVLGAAAALAAGGLGWFVLRESGAPTDPFPPDIHRSGPGGALDDAGAAGPGGAGAGAVGPGGNPGVSRAGGGGAGTVPARPALTPAQLEAKHALREERAALNEREPPPPSERGVGPVEGEWTKAQAERVEALRLKAHETILKDRKYQRMTLGDVLRDVSASSGIAIEIEGEGIGDEAVNLVGEEIPVHEVLMQISVRRNLWFRIEPEKIVVGR